MRTTATPVLSTAVLALSACGGTSIANSIDRPATAQVCTGFKRAGDTFRTAGTFDARQVLGLKVDEAERIARRYGCGISVLENQDGMVAKTMDLRPWRINVWTKRDYVISIDHIG